MSPNLKTWIAGAAVALFGGCVVTSSDDDEKGGGGSGGSSGDETCTLENVTDVSSCEAACDTTIEGSDDIHLCTESCSVSSPSCPDSGQVCLELTDGSGACFVSCDADADCKASGYCDTDLDACLPGSEPVTDGACVPSNVGDLDDCDADCDTAIEGAAGIYECTVSCDPAGQTCSLAGQICVELEDGTGACLDDCLESRICPDSGDTCDPDLFICLPQIVD